MSRHLLVALASAAFLLSGGVFSNKKPIKHIQRTSPKVDTGRTSPIPIKSCQEYDEYQEGRKWNYGKIESLHEMVCWWAVDEQQLSLDPEVLPSYVKTSEDSLQLGDMLAYGVELDPRTSSPETQRLYFFVAEVGDSLYHKNTMGFKPEKDVQTKIRVGGLRPIEVPGASTQYIWFEVRTKSVSPKTKGESWTGHILTYDQRRGVRYLSYAPVRSEAYEENGELSGLYQLDVSVPEPGLMKIEERTYKGKTKSRGWVDWIGLHVIDPEATEKQKYDAMPTTGSYVVIESTKADAWDRQSQYIWVVPPSKMEEYTPQE